MVNYAKYNAERAARDEKLRRKYAAVTAKCAAESKKRAARDEKLRQKYAAVTAQYAREHLAKSAGK